MIRHILLVQFKEDASPKAIEQVFAAFKAIPTKVTGIESVEWGENNSPEEKNEGFTHCIQMTFNDQEARDNYLPHPDHEGLKALFEPVLDNIIVLDYSI